MGKEVGEGFSIGNSCTPVADSCQCMAKPIQYRKVKLKKKKTFLKKNIDMESKFDIILVIKYR